MTKKKSTVYIILVVGFLFATGCIALYLYSLSSFDFYCETVHRVAELDGTVYILTTDSESNYRRYATGNMGETWYQIEEMSEQVFESLRFPNPTPMPSEFCDPTELQNCYRILTVSKKIESSTDGGETWDYFRIPVKLNAKSGCEQPEPTSMSLVTNSEQNTTFIFGMGTGGVAMHSANGDWSFSDIDSLHEAK